MAVDRNGRALLCQACVDQARKGGKNRVRKATAAAMNRVGMKIGLCDPHSVEMKELDRLARVEGNRYRQLYPNEVFDPVLTPQTLPNGVSLAELGGGRGRDGR